MFSWLFKEKALSHFESCQELKQLRPLIKKLRDKEVELQADAKRNGPASHDHRKHTVVFNLLANLDVKIQKFNQRQPQKKHDDEVLEIITFVRELAAIVRNCSLTFESTLMAPRNVKRQAATMAEGVAIGVGTYGAAGYAIFNLPIGIIGSLVTFFYIAPKVNKKVTEAAGLNKVAFLTASIQIIDELADTLTKIGENLGLAKFWNRKLQVDNDTIPSEFICMITGNVMTKPMFCSLDQRTYQEEAIREWLLTHGTSPYTRKPLEPGEEVDKVLSLNRNLLEAIERSRAENPKLYDSEYQQENVRLIK